MTLNEISGGSMDTEKNDWHVKPMGSPSSMPDTIVIPDA